MDLNDDMSPNPVIQFQPLKINVLITINIVMQKVPSSYVILGLEHV